jgi:CTP:molybdopterin cytidylyltransferase MocA
MGRLKQLLPIRNKPAIRHCVEALLSAGIRDIVIVLAPTGAEIAATIDDFPVSVVFNERAESEMADSVRTGLRSLHPSSSAVLVCLCDHPLVSPETMKTLLHLHREDPLRIIIPTYNGKRGHPTLFPKSVLAEMMHGLTLREVIRKKPDRVLQVEVADEGVILDMDTMEDYKKISRRTMP